MESEFDLKTLRLVFPWAEMSLEQWMRRATIPPNLASKSRPDRRTYLFESICALVSALSYLHREFEGTITGHHDLKPSNIMVIDGKLVLIDFGRSHLRQISLGSETEGDRGLGTYDYHPPEYWKDDGTRDRDVKHGRAFDVWGIGCIIIGLATLIIDDWRTGMVSAFERRRSDNRNKERPKIPEVQEKEVDRSFHNNYNIVKDWIQHLRSHTDATPKLGRVLDVATAMLAKEKANRLFTWEAEMDLYEIQSFDDPENLRNLGALRVERPSSKFHNGQETPLHRAIKNGAWERVRLLLDAQWPLFVQDTHGTTPFKMLSQIERVAESTENSRFGTYLEDHFRYMRPRTPNIQDQGSRLLSAASNNEIEIVQRLLEEGVNPLVINEEGHSALLEAATYGHLAVVKCLLRTQAKEQLMLRDPKWRDTPLLRAAAKGHSPIVKLLLETSFGGGYCPDIEDHQREGKTALYLATEWRHQDVVVVLLAQKAQVFTQRTEAVQASPMTDRQTPIHSAAQYGYKNILELLLEANDASKCLRHKDWAGLTPIELACKNGKSECEQILRRRMNDEEP